MRDAGRESHVSREARAARLPARSEWPTWALLIVTYGAWGWATTAGAGLHLGLAALITIVCGALHSSLTHEALHGHPTRWAWVNATLVFPALSVAVPYLRFKDTHLAHHQDACLTDPYDDPETNFRDPAIWARMSKVQQAVCLINNTLLGRMVLGPLLGQVAFMAADWRLIRGGDRRVLLGWLLHIPAVAVVLAWMIWLAAMPMWLFAVCVYGSLALLKIRTFLEHRAHEKARARTVIVEDRGPLALLFLNNNLHAVHHMHPRVAWYQLPALYRRHKARFQRCNDSYIYRSYAEIFRHYSWRAKDPVAHPLWQRDP